MKQPTKYYVILAWDTVNPIRQFYTRFRQGKYHFSNNINEAEMYVKRAWAEKCKNKILKAYNDGVLFNNALSAEVISMGR